MNMLTRDEARAYFKARGLTYDDITIRRLRYLQVEVDEQFNQVRKTCINGEGDEYWVRVNDAKRFKGEYAEDGHAVCAYLTAKGTHFTAREVVSFNRDGFIGFCGEADWNNAQPVLRAFISWCDWMAQDKETP